MSVNIEGQKGYDYQYKVTVLIALLFSENSSLYVESEGIEDAFLQLNDYRVEIQAKREKERLTVSKLTRWLSHFEERKTNNNLLSCLKRNQKTHALFITQSRSSDQIANLNNEIGDISTHSNISINREWKSEFISTLKDYQSPSVSLLLERKEFCEKQTKDYSRIKDIKEILKRVHIWDCLSDFDVEKKIISILNLDFKIATSKANQVYETLFNVIKNGRNNGSDIMPLVRKTVENNKITRPTISNDYLTRKEENSLKIYIEEHNVLLLTGISLCGKSELAKYIALYYWELGYDYEISNSVDEISRFLGQNIRDNKIAIIEDPWGHNKEIENSNLKSKVLTVIQNIQPNHKLIITSRLEIIQDVFNFIELSKCKINNHPWFDLTIRNSGEIMKHWGDIGLSKKLPSRLIKTVKVNLSDLRNNFLQIGQLNYLSNVYDIDELAYKPFSVVEHIARHNAQDIAKDLKSKNSNVAEIFSILGLVANTITPVHKEDFAFILSSDTNEYSISKSNLFRLYFSKNDEILFEYKDNYQLSESENQCLEYLEERGFIKVKNESILFSHPNYYEASRTLFINRSNSKQKRFFSRLEKALNCLNTETAYLATKQLPFIFEYVKNYRAEIIEYGLYANNSIFPAVRDCSLVFLADQIDFVSKDYQSKIINSLRVNRSSESNIRWYQNRVPYIYDGAVDFFENYEKRYYQNVTQKILDGIIEKHEKGEAISIYDVWIFLLNNKSKLELSFLESLLQYNEVFIRVEVTNQLLKYFSEKDRELVIKVFNDENPNVIYSAISASIINLKFYSIDNQKFISELIINSLEKKSVAIRSYDLIATFATDYGGVGSFIWQDLNNNQKHNLWNLWVSMFPVATKNLPVKLEMNTPRFGATMNEAMNNLDEEQGVIVLQAWYERIDLQLKNRVMLDGYCLAIADNLISLTKNNSLIRKEIFTKLLTHYNTGFVISSLRWFVGYWDDYLDINEKKQIIEVLSTKRSDVKWLKAAMTTFNSPPKEILELVFGYDVININAEIIIRETPEELLSDCLTIYLGKASPCISIGLGTSNNAFWGPIVTTILLNENSKFFNICLHDFLSKLASFVPKYFKDWKNIWITICNNTINKKRLVEEWIYIVVFNTYNIEQTAFLWRILVDSYSQKGQENEIIEIILDNISLLQHSYYKDEIFFEIFEKSFFDKIIRKLQLLENKIQKVGDEQLEIISKRYYIRKLDNWIE